MKDDSSECTRFALLNIIKLEINMDNEPYMQIPKLAQRQDSFLDQMIDLYKVAVKLGMYDAAEKLKETWLD